MSHGPRNGCTCPLELPILTTLIAEAKPVIFTYYLESRRYCLDFRSPVCDLPLWWQCCRDETSCPSGSRCQPLVIWSMSHGPPNGCTCPLTEPSISRNKRVSVSITSSRLTIFSWFRAFILFTSRKSPEAGGALLTLPNDLMTNSVLSQNRTELRSANQPLPII